MDSRTTGVATTTTTATASSSGTTVCGTTRQRRFLTQREYRERLAGSPVAAVSTFASWPVTHESLPVAPTDEKNSPLPATPVALKTPTRKLSAADTAEASGESEVETHVSDSSELPSSASAVAARLEASGSTDHNIISEIQRLRQENSVLRAENAVLRNSPGEESTEVLSTTAVLVCGIPAAKHIRFGAPLRYMVAPRIGDPSDSFELFFDAADTAKIKLQFN